MRKFSIGLIVGMIAALALGSAIAQQRKPPTVYSEEFRMDPDAPGGFVPMNPGWKQLTDETALQLYTDDFGVRRATLMVFVDERWRKVAVDGPEALMPQALPAR